VKQYTDVVLDRSGNVVPGATVTVTNYPSGTSATVYSANVVGANANPLTTDTNGRFTFYAPNGRYTFTVSKTGITTATQSDVPIFDNPVSINEYKSSGDTDDTLSFQRAATALVAAGGGTLILEAGINYTVFTGAVSQTFLMNLTGCTNVTILGNGATITSALVNTAQSIICFYGAPISGLRVQDLKFVGGNTTLASSTGESFVLFGGGSKNIHVSNVDVRNCKLGVACQDQATTQTGVTLLNGYFDKCFYPLNLYGTHDVLARGFTTRNCGRSYFPVAPGSNHDISLDSQSGYTSSDCLLKVYADSAGSVAQNTLSDIKLNYRSAARTSGAGNAADGMVQMDIEQLSGSTAAGHFRNIQINFDVDAGSGSDKPGNLFGMNKYFSGGGGHDTTARGHTIRNVTFTGSAINCNNLGGTGISICNTSGGDVWTGDTVSGFALRDLQLIGAPPTDSIYINGQGAESGKQFITMDNVRVDGSITKANMTGVASSRRTVGSFTPGIAFGGGTTGLTYATQTGSYTWDNDRITISGYIGLSAKGSSTGAAKITGLPFAVRNSNDSNAPVSLYLTGVTFTGQHQGFVDLGATTATLAQVSEAGTASNLTESNFSNASGLFFTAIYRTDA
jgi:hypothetical protein